jgi:hypothetical protein
MWVYVCLCVCVCVCECVSVNVRHALVHSLHWVLTSAYPTCLAERICRPAIKDVHNITKQKTSSCHAMHFGVFRRLKRKKNRQKRQTGGQGRARAGRCLPRPCLKEIGLNFTNKLGHFSKRCLLFSMGNWTTVKSNEEWSEEERFWNFRTKQISKMWTGIRSYWPNRQTV